MFYVLHNLRTGKVLTCSYWQVQGLNQTYPIVTKIIVKLFNKKMLWNLHDKKKISLLEHLTWYPFDNLFVCDWVRIYLVKDLFPPHHIYRPETQRYTNGTSLSSMVSNQRKDHKGPNETRFCHRHLPALAKWSVLMVSPSIRLFELAESQICLILY